MNRAEKLSRHLTVTCTASEINSDLTIFQDIPTIDFADLYPKEQRTAEAVEKVVEQLKKCIFTLGFFYIKNTCVPLELIHKVKQITKDFFALPDAEKKKFQRSDYRGYQAYEQENVSALWGDKYNQRDMAEKFSTGRQVSEEERKAHPDPNYYDHPYYAENVFPDLGGSQTSFRELWLESYQKFQDLSDDLLELISLCLGIPIDTWKVDTSLPTGIHRCLVYPDVPKEKCATDRVRIAAHFDIDTVTILHQDMPKNGVSCLQALFPGQSEYQNVTPRPDALVVNFGKILNFWTGGRIVSTKHRVRAPPVESLSEGSARCSLIFFAQPNYDTIIKPLDSEMDGCDVAFTEGDYESVVNEIGDKCDESGGISFADLSSHMRSRIQNN